MIKEIVKNAKEWGNGAGVLLPREWKGKEVKVTLIDRSLEIKKEVFDILNEYLEDILGIYLIGSYARGEGKKRSDVDLLVITNKTNEKIEKGKYNFILIAKEAVERSLENNVLPLLPMLKEAKSLLNSKLIEDYKKTKLTKKNLKFHIETTKSAMKLVKEFIESDRTDNKKISDRVMYSLGLRLREVYIVDCLIKNKKITTRGLFKIIEQMNAKETYEAYLRSKDTDSAKRKVEIDEAEKAYSYILKKIKEQEKWVKRRGKRKK